ncbi:MAG TPA: hypothetical protein VGZ32_08980 [Actinocrinis sp.]|jgi:2-methylcitrate dehydratase PrpD|uniref:hypothetical protein n=1 Tax=Actinocrinis sp. TaxID=1920516 RepID=UPI002DDCF1FC|nr:hypothetical protein [Actinocrinis sp.]HEV3170460.1 hypothetical protein [Actinocrinis sp.]
MSIGANVSVIAFGAILAFATHVHTPGLNVGAIGAVLIAVGVVGLVMQLTSLARQRKLTAVTVAQGSAVVVRPYDDRPGEPPYGDPDGEDGGF